MFLPASVSFLILVSLPEISSLPFLEWLVVLQDCSQFAPPGHIYGLHPWVFCSQLLLGFGCSGGNSESVCVGGGE